MEEELIDEIEQDVEEEVVVETKETKTTKRRKTFAADNVYVFTDAKDAQVAIKDQALKYSDGSSVDNLRVFSILKGEKPTGEDDEDKREVLCYVVSRNASYATEAYLSQKNISAELTFKKKRGGGGRSKTKIEAAHLEMGKALFRMIEAGTAPDPIINNFNKMYGPDGEFSHYRDDKGNWKEATH